MLLLDDASDLLYAPDRIGLHIQARIVQVLDEGGTYPLLQRFLDLLLLRQPLHLLAQIHRSHKSIVLVVMLTLLEQIHDLSC